MQESRSCIEADSSTNILNCVQATANSVRDRLLESWNDNQQYYRDNDSKRVYYLSMEFLMGKALSSSNLYALPFSSSLPCVRIAFT